MIDKKIIEQIVDDNLDKEKYFVVEVVVSTSNQILVYIDGFEGFNIDACKKISRAIDASFDREQDDFSLEVSSAGLDQPFRVPQQYEKNLGSLVRVTDLDSKKHVGILTQYNDEGVEIEIEKTVKLEGKKKKQLVKEKLFFEYHNVKSTKVEISFK